MAELKQFRLPDVGEGLTEADILSWAVAVGDEVVVNQTLVEVETAKAAVELPSPFKGVVHALHAEAGETVEVGRPIITIDVAPGGGPTPPPTTGEDAPASSNGAGAASAIDAEPAGERQAVLVGYGPRSAGGSRRAHRVANREPVPTAQGAFARMPAPPAHKELDATRAPARALAKPPVRKLAKTMGIDLDAVTATGPNGSVSRDDLARVAAAVQPPSDATRSAREPGERETRIPIRGVRKHTAAAMVASAFTAPHVSEFITVDVTAMMELRERIAGRREFADVKVSPLLILARAVLWAVRRNPTLNSTWDEAAQEIVEKHYVNLGIAAATERGLVVPNIKDADQLSLRELAGSLDDLAATARAGRTTPAALGGGTITITNVGVFGVDTGTPIINPGEVAIVAFGAVRRQPWVVGSGADERIEPRWVTQLCVSFDHRVVDGAEGSRFLADVAAFLHDPSLAVL